MLSQIEFQRQCAAQGAVLYGELGNASDPFYATYDAGWMIKQGDQLSSGPIEDTSFCTDAISSALATIINSSHGTETPRALHTQQRDEAIVGCSSAEDRIGRWLAGLARRWKVGGWIIVDDQRQPVAIKKEQLSGRNSGFYGESAALLLQDVVMMGTDKTGRERNIVAPRGSLACMQLSGRARAARREDNLTVVTHFSEVEAILYSRMTGIALSDEDWVKFYASQEDVVRSSTMHFNRAFGIVSKALERPEMQA
jgi:hypothetical protein